MFSHLCLNVHQQLPQTIRTWLFTKRCVQTWTPGNCVSEFFRRFFAIHILPTQQEIVGRNGRNISGNTLRRLGRACGRQDVTIYVNCKFDSWSRWKRARKCQTGTIVDVCVLTHGKRPYSSAALNVQVWYAKMTHSSKLKLSSPKWLRRVLSSRHAVPRCGC